MSSVNISKDTAWLKKFEELKQFKLCNGHCNVPCRFSKNPSLGLWVNTQRTQYRCMKQGTASSITDHHIQLLEGIGFIFDDYKRKAWVKKYEELKRIKCREGDCNISTRFDENPSLGEWVSTQRNQYKLMKQGVKSSMTDQRIQALEAIGFKWNMLVQHHIEFENVVSSS